jgi:hypothetical protein
MVIQLFWGGKLRWRKAEAFRRKGEVDCYPWRSLLIPKQEDGPPSCGETHASEVISRNSKRRVDVNVQFVRTVAVVTLG